MPRIKGRQVGLGTLDNTHLAASAGILLSQLAEGSLLLKRDGSVALSGNLPAGGNKIVNLGSPTAGSNDAARIVDVENAIAAINSIFDSKPSARAATTANININSPGTTHDSVSFTTGQLLLVRAQSAPAENGLYVFNGAASPLTRHSTMDSWAEIPGAVIAIEEGSTYAESLFLCTADQGGTLGTTAITFQTVNGAGLNNSNFVANEVPSGTVNGSNTAFNLANTPTTGSLALYVNGIRQTPGAGNDYTISGAAITMLVAPETGDVILADYRK